MNQLRFRLSDASLKMGYNDGKQCDVDEKIVFVATCCRKFS